MDHFEKLALLKQLLKNDNVELPDDDLLNAYLKLSAQEIISWLYSAKGKISEDIKVPMQYEVTQIMACVAGFTISGAEGQLSHSENGIGRVFKYEDMIAYVRSKVVPYVGVM